jgi:hypothetical protein
MWYFTTKSALRKKKRKITDYSLLQEEHTGFIYFYYFITKKVARIEWAESLTNKYYHLMQKAVILKNKQVIVRRRFVFIVWFILLLWFIFALPEKIHVFFNIKRHVFLFLFSLSFSATFYYLYLSSSYEIQTKLHSCKCYHLP